ncbi:NAD(P)/FAD-dependent oxidoreductase [Chloroflexota bacterium]
MNEYDIIVVGAGPAGSAAAKAIAEGGLDVLILEEHPIVGIPDHCWGLLSNGVIPRAPRDKGPTITQKIMDTMSKDVIVQEYSAVRVYAPNGKVVKEASVAGTGDYLVRRDEFDRELTKQAINAGADIKLNTRVTGLLKKDGKVIGVNTNYNSMPELYAKLVIGTDGIHAAQKGIPKWEGIIRDDQPFINGITLELTRVRGIDHDVRELHTGAIMKRGWAGVCPRDDVSCTTDFTSMAEFEQLKTGGYAISTKLKEANPVRMVGWSHPEDLGVGISRVIDDGLIIAGSAASLMGIPGAITSGRYAGEVAVEAVKEGDVTAKKLGKYAELYETMKGPVGFKDSLPFYDCSDEEIEKRLLGMLE